MTLELAKKLPDTITTKRLVLRTPNLTDSPELQRLANDKHIYNMLARLPHPYTHADAVNFITNIARTKIEHDYAIITKTDDLIGVAGLNLNQDLSLELGYWLGRPFWGKGYATQAVQAIVQAASKTGYTEIFARAKSSNSGSIRVLEKSGFIKISEGIDDCGVHKGVQVTNFKWEQDNG